MARSEHARLTNPTAADRICAHVGDAHAILGEAIELRAASDRGEVKLSLLEDQIVPRAREAIRLAPKDRDILFISAYLMGPYCPVNRSVAKEVRGLYKTLDKLGGPTQQGLEFAGGPAGYERERARHR